MGYQLKSARFLAQDALRALLSEGCTAVDCTAGNGHDTCFLAGLCGSTGHVYAFDIQEDALASAAALLQREGLSDRVTLIHDGHQNILRHLSMPVDAVSPLGMEAIIAGSTTATSGMSFGSTQTNFRFFSTSVIT